MKIGNEKIKIKRLGLVFMMALSFQACQVEDKTQIEMPEKPYVLQHDTKLIVLEFHGRASKLSEDQEERLLAALKPSGPGKVSVHITLPQKASPLGKTRIKHVVRTLLEAGVKAKQIHKSNALLPPNDSTMEVFLDTYRAIPPLCPNWSTQFGSGYDRGRTSNFGCSTAVNFLLMLDDPIVLFRGEPALSRDSARDSLSIEDHRAGKDKGKWLKTEQTSSGSSSSSSGTAGGTTPGGL